MAFTLPDPGPPNLDFERPADRARLLAVQLVGEPAHAERSGGDGMGGNRLHSSG